MLAQLKYVLLLVVVSFSSHGFAKPHYEEVPLKEFTAMDLYIVPDLGTRLVFPFLLGAISHTPQVNFTLTNENAFSVSKADDVKSQNVFIIEAKEPKYLSKRREQNQKVGIEDYPISHLYINVDGFNLSIRLIPTFDLTQHHSDIVLTLSEEKREFLMEKAIQTRMEQLAKEKQAFSQGMEQQAKTAALSHVGALALEEPHQQNIKERFKQTLETGERIELFADHFKIYDSGFYMVVFDVVNRSPEFLGSLNAEVASVEGEHEISLDSSLYCQAALNADSRTRCVLTTQDKRLVKGKKLNLTVATARGEIKAVW